MKPGLPRLVLTHLLLAVLIFAGAFALMPRRLVYAEARAGVEGGRLEISARPIRNFRIGSSQTRFGPLEFVGGLELSSASGSFGGLSSFRFLTPGQDFIGVSDTGFWFFGTLVHDDEARPAGLRDFRMQQIFDRSGSLSGHKRGIDAEGLDVRDGVATVGFERDHRIAQFRIDPDDMKPAFRNLDFLIPKHELRQNRSFETVVHFPPDGPRGGGLVVITEMSLDRNGNIFAAILEGPGKGIFTVRREGAFDITDGAFLNNGDLLLLERSFSMMTGVRMRLRQIPGDSIVKGALVDGPVLFEANMRYQIDNMEGMDVWTRADGAQIVSLISDDNHSILQRTLYLEFVLHDEDAGQQAAP